MPKSKTEIIGQSPSGIPRSLVVTALEDGNVELWIKPLNSENGYKIDVCPSQLKLLLKNVLG